MLVWMLIVLAVAVLLWPASPPPSNPFVRPDSSKPSPQSTTYMAAVGSLQVVRSRLASTEKLDAEAQKALDCLTLALSSGSDK